MTKEQAIAIVVDIASRWGENAEEELSRRVSKDDDDDACQRIADDSDEELSEIYELRDLWRAIDLLTKAGAPEGGVNLSDGDFE